jgi:hypothetical protein
LAWFLSVENWVTPNLGQWSDEGQPGKEDRDVTEPMWQRAEAVHTEVSEPAGEAGHDLDIAQVGDHPVEKSSGANVIKQLDYSAIWIDLLIFKTSFAKQYVCYHIKISRYFTVSATATAKLDW